MKNKILNLFEKVRSPDPVMGEGLRTKIASTKKGLIIISILFLIVWLNIGTIAGIITSRESIKADLEKNLSEKFSATVKINGDVEFSTKPEPNILVSDIVIEKPGLSPKGKNLVKIRKFKGTTSLTSIFSGSYNLKSVQMEGVEIHSYSTSESNNFLYFLLENDFGEVKVDIKNLKLYNYRRNEINHSKDIVRLNRFDSFSIDPSPAKGSYIINGSIKDGNSNSIYYFSLDLEDGISSNTDYTGKIYSDNTEIILEGNLNIDRNLKFSGQISGYIGGVTSNLIISLGGKDLINDLKSSDRSKVSGSYEYNSQKFTTKNLLIDGPIALYKAKMSADLKDKIDVSFKVVIPELKYFELFKSREEYLASKTVIEIEQDFQKKLNNFFLFSLNDDVSFNFDLRVNKIQFANKGRGALLVSASLKDRIFKLKDFKLVLPGSSALKVVSKVKINRHDHKLSGSLEFLTYGKDFGKAFGALGKEYSSGNGVIKEFYIKSKAYIYEQKVHFREIVAQLNRAKLAGQLLIDYSKDFSASSAITFNRLNLDEYFTSLGNNESNQNDIANKLDFIGVFDSFFDNLDISISSKNVTKSGVHLQDFSIFTRISPGIVHVKDSFFHTEATGDFRGEAKFDISEFQPKIDLNLRLEKFDFDYLLYGKIKSDNDNYIPQGNWSKSKIDLRKLTSILGNFQFSIDNLKVAHFDLTDFRTSLNMLGEKVVIGKSRFEIYNSKVSFEGNFTTEYPSFNLKFEASELSFNKIFKNFFGIDSIAGKFNSSGVLSSTGYTYEDIISKMNGRINLVSNGFAIRGFNLPSYSLGLAKVRRVEQVKLVSEELLNSGSTNFGYLGTAVLISAGKFIFNDIPFQSEYTRSVTSSGEIDLLNWNMNIKTKFDVITADNYNVPISLVTSGSFQDRKLEWEYSSAKKYWEEKFYGGKIY